MEHLKALCEELGLTIAEVHGEAVDMAQSKQEIVLLQLFRGLDDTTRELAIAWFKAFEVKE